jgi:putative endonuclease
MRGSGPRSGPPKCTHLAISSLIRHPSVRPAVHILRCAEGLYCTGLCQDADLDRRGSKHQNANHPMSDTGMRRPVELVFAEHFERLTDAIAAERRIKGWSRAKTDAMIAGAWERLPVLAKRPGARAKLRLG